MRVFNLKIICIFMVDLDQIREEVVSTAQKMYENGLVENGEGNVSIRVGRNEIMCTPTSTPYELLTPDKIVHMDLDGNVIGSNKIPSTEVKMHLAIYKDRRKAKCVIHDHSTYVSMLSAVRMNLPVMMEQQIIFLGGEINCTKITEAHTEEMGSVAIEALGKNNCAILANHGAVVCGKSADHALRFAIIFEKMAKVYWGARQIGEPLEVPKENWEEHEKMFEGLFACYPRRLK
jgi:L-ribulose-5-phosphate 4-epimerase